MTVASAYPTLAHRCREPDGTLRDKSDLLEAIVEGAAKRMRSKLMRWRP